MGGALVAALRGTDGVGAYTNRDQGRWLDWFEDRRNEPCPPPAPGRIAEFGVLLDRAQSTDYAPRMMSSPVVLSTDELNDLNRLNEFRGHLAHVKPTYWALEVSGLPRICGVAARLIAKLFEMMPVYAHLKADLHHEVRMALSIVQELAERLPSMPPDSSAIDRGSKAKNAS